MDKKLQKEEQQRIAENQVGASRSEQNSKHKKTSITLNVLIVVMILAIIGVLWLVFFLTADDSKDQVETKPATTQTQKSDETKKDDSKSEDTKKTEEQTTETSDDPNVSKVIKKDWKPVGTEQKGDHVNSYEMDSQDWEEKVNAFSEATGIANGDMTIWYVGRGEEPATQSIGTISTKTDPDKAFRVYITWVDGSGWQPTKVEELKTNDKSN
ncbi:DUF1510 family protein [Listeria weihenstephanensis]|uniref:DUF1510 family protein n=2 Tax=Listeria weihenstephanensis TaxID=1006155 RepID=A0A1S7FUT6_9LIST|nr:YrrS family protein [Listeria weihenstephanensis]AQY51214.1 hypothetical protein UE46_09225 [Listeria weihenstephanensis]MBC1501108.1 DUF1510 family protein [Listeria weihenstephanensis]